MQNLGGKQGINVPMANTYAKKQLSVKYFVFGFIHSVILKQQHLMAVLKINPVAISDFRLDQKLEHLNPATNLLAQFAQQTKGSCVKWLKFPRHISSQQKFLLEDLTGIKGTEVVLSTANFGYLLQRKSAQ